MDNQISLDEVNNFIAKFKMKKKQKATSIPTNNLPPQNQAQLQTEQIFNQPNTQSTIPVQKPIISQPVIQSLPKEIPKRKENKIIHEKKIDTLPVQQFESNPSNIFDGGNDQNVDSIFGNNNDDINGKNEKTPGSDALFDSTPKENPKIERPGPPKIKFRPPVLSKKINNIPAKPETSTQINEIKKPTPPIINKQKFEPIKSHTQPFPVQVHNETEKTNAFGNSISTKIETTPVINNEINANPEDIFNSEPKNETPQVFDYQQNEQEQTQSKGSFSIKNVYNNFSSELKAKANVFESDDLSKEIEKLDDDDTTNQPDLSQQAGNDQNNYQEQHKPSYQESVPSSSSPMIINQDYRRDSDANSQVTNMNVGAVFSGGNILSSYGNTIYIKSQTCLLNRYEMRLYNEYYPCAYSDKFDFEKSISLLDIIKSYYDSDVVVNDISFLNTYLAVFFEIMILKNQMKLKASNIFSRENYLIKSNLVDTIKLKLNQSQKNIFSFELNETDTISEEKITFDLANSNLSHLSQNCFSQNNLTSLLLISLINKKEEINDYIGTFYDRGYLNKNSYFYLLYLINSGRIYNNNLPADDVDIIFKNFPLFFLILLENFNEQNYSSLTTIVDLLIVMNSKYKTLLHYIILKFIKCDFTIENQKSYALIFTSFLNHPSIGKILVADIFNYTLFTLNSSLPQIIAKSSIMVKFKYTSIKQYDNDSNVYNLGEKINENLNQFGLYSKNKYFQEYINDLYPIDESKRIVNKPVVQNQQKDIQPQRAQQDQKSGGIFSLFSNALGIGGNNPQNQVQKASLQNIDKSKLTPEELWELEHPGEPEIYYDEKLKRYVLRGQIYDDQEEVEQKKKEEKPFVPPPKINKPKPQIQPHQMESKVENTLQPNIQTTSTQNTPAKVNNPFGPRKPPVAPQRKLPTQFGLSNRYAVAYQK